MLNRQSQSGVPLGGGLLTGLYGTASKTGADQTVVAAAGATAITNLVVPMVRDPRDTWGLVMMVQLNVWCAVTLAVGTLQVVLGAATSTGSIIGPIVDVTEQMTITELVYFTPAQVAAAAVAGVVTPVINLTVITQNIIVYSNETKYFYAAVAQ